MKATNADPAGRGAPAKKGKDPCDACDAREGAALCGSETAALAAFARVHHPHRYLAKQTLYHEGTPALGLYVVCGGRIKVSRADGNGREQILRLVVRTDRRQVILVRPERLEALS